MQRKIKFQESNLRIAHQSEVLLLKKQLAIVEAKLNAFQKLHSEVSVEKTEDLTPKKPLRIALPTDNGFQFIAIENILFCEASGNYTSVHLIEINDNRKSTTRILISKTLKTIAELIGQTHFIRCHKSYLINKKHITGYQLKKGLHVELSNGKSIPVSRRNKKKLLQTLDVII